MTRLLPLLLAACAQDPIDTIRAEDYRRHIEFLASPEMKGRDNDTPEGEKAAQYVADEMKRIGLKPGGKDGYFHRFRTTKARGGEVKEFGGINVVGVLEGTELRNEYIVVNGHHDHLGVVQGSVRAGADDNASGVAMVLELAEAFAKKRPKRSMLFVSFDCEEDGLVGSREFVASGLYDPATIAADFCFDLIGGDFYPWESSTIYALGSEYSPELSATVKAHSLDGLQVRQAGVYLIEPMGFARSDYANFRIKRIPFVFFSTGTPWYYHTSFDTPDKINWNKITLAGKYCFGVISEVADGERRPTMGKKPPPSLDDARLMRDAIGKVLESTEIRVSDDQKAKGRKLLERLESILKLPELTAQQEEEIRQGMVWLFVVQSRQVESKGK